MSHKPKAPEHPYDAARAHHESTGGVPWGSLSPADQAAAVERHVARSKPKGASADLPDLPDQP